MVIAGTVIGGGMFALPVDLPEPGFFGALLFLLSPGFQCTFRAIIIRSKLKLSRRIQFYTITKDLIGNTWNIISGITVASFSISSLMPISLLMVRSLVNDINEFGLSR